MITVSIVSHGHSEYVSYLLADLAKCSNISCVIVINNIQDKIPINNNFNFKLLVINNIDRYGYGENNNIAFGLVTTKYFCVLNPDIRIFSDPFGDLIDKISDSQFGVVAPAIRNMNGLLMNSSGSFPNFLTVIKKFFRILFNYPSFHKKTRSDFLCGMFMFFESSSYRKIGGFDSRFFIYYEDVDICWRLWLKLGLKSHIVEHREVYHVGQFSSHSNIRFFIIHLKSFLLWNCIYFFKFFKKNI
jgi:GT2 family glycosyltransferase